MPTAPYGAWPSPVSQLPWRPPRASATRSRGSATDGSTWWLERRPSDDGRTTLVRDGEDVTPPGRERAHPRARVRRRRLVAPRRHRLLLRVRRPAPLPPGPRRRAARRSRPSRRARRSMRYADGRVSPGRRAGRLRARDPRRGRRARERPGGAARRRLRRAAGARLRPRLLRLPAASAPTAPTLALDLLGPPQHAVGRHRAVGGAARRARRQARLVAGGRSESIWQPEWSPDGALHCVSDRSGWWNLYREGEQLTDEQAELGYPQWGFGGSTYAFLEGGDIACVRVRGRRGAALACCAPARAASRTSAFPTRPWATRTCAALGERVVYVAEGADRGGGRGELARGRGRARAVTPATRRSRPSGRPSRGRSSSRAPTGARRTPSGTRRRNPGYEGAAGRAAADDRAGPRRPDRPRDPRCSTRRSRSGRAAASAWWT